jgi:hypothetical protein
MGGSDERGGYGTHLQAAPTSYPARHARFRCSAGRSERASIMARRCCSTKWCIREVFRIRIVTCEE